MKKFLLCLAVFLPFSLGYCQEFSLVTRAEFASSDETHLGNSSIYGLVDGTFAGNFFYSSQLYLLNSDPAGLYSDPVSNVINWAYLGYDFGSIQLSAGKIVVPWGTYELDEYDFDTWYEMASSFWMGSNAYALSGFYQWGAQLDWPINEASNITAGITPTTLNLLYKNSLESVSWLELVSSVNFQRLSTDDKIGYLNLGLRASAGDMTFTLDNTRLLNAGFGGNAALSADYSFSDKCNLLLRAGLENKVFDQEDMRLYSGALLTWYPIESLRLHGCVSYDSFIGGVAANLGLTWIISL